METERERASGASRGGRGQRVTGTVLDQGVASGKGPIRIVRREGEGEAIEVTPPFVPVGGGAARGRTAQDEEMDRGS